MRTGDLFLTLVGGASQYFWTYLESLRLTAKICTEAFYRAGDDSEN